MFKSGFISIIGRPNVGKSTLLNTLLTQKVSITSHKPQTTRDCIKGILNTKTSQAVFIDTPGLHKSKSKLNKFMASESFSSFPDADIIFFMTDIDERSKDMDEGIIKKIRSFNKPIFLILNKIDLITSKDKLLPLIKHYEGILPVNEIFPVSARDSISVKSLKNKLTDYLPHGPKYYPDDMITDKPEYFLISEIIREKATIHSQDEIPYSIAVVIEKIERKKGITVIHSIIYVERDSQKGILIGKNGSFLKKIGQKARVDIEKLLDSKVYLSLLVRVKEKWTTNDKSLKEFGYFNS